jgi:hypothetical protein
MKKFLYTLALVVFASVAMISCADEEIKAKDSIGSAGGSGSAKGF